MASFLSESDLVHFVHHGDNMANNSNTQPVIAPLTVEEEGVFLFIELSCNIHQTWKADGERCSDQIIFARITNDERPLRRVIKKFHGYTSLSHPPIVPPITPSGSSSVEDAREAFLVDLASFQLLMKKSAMICEAEARQVEEYQRERRRLGERVYNLFIHARAYFFSER